MEHCQYCSGTKYTHEPFRVTTQAGAVREVVFNYCPSCGRMLKPADPVSAAYLKLVQLAHTHSTPEELTAGIEETIGYLGEALE